MTQGFQHMKPLFTVFHKTLLFFSKKIKMWKQSKPEQQQHAYMKLEGRGSWTIKIKLLSFKNTVWLLHQMVAYVFSVMVNFSLGLWLHLLAILLASLQRLWPKHISSGEIQKAKLKLMNNLERNSPKTAQFKFKYFQKAMMKVIIHLLAVFISSMPLTE